jgi:6-phosphofructokinase 1
MITAEDLYIRTLGEPTHDSPFAHFLAERAQARGTHQFKHMVYDDAWPPSEPTNGDHPAFELAGAEPRLFFEPTQTTVGIVTCGGLCPGLNDVIRGLTMVLWHRYGVRKILGFRYGYEGINPAFGHEPIQLDPEIVGSIHEQGGTMLGSSRGPQDTGVMVDNLQSLGVNILFCIGGDGTLRGALDISVEARRRGAPISVVGIPKTIDNDIKYVEQSFGLITASSMAHEAVTAAHNEARGARRGIGLVKLMGRHSGFISAGAALASNDVNYVLIPEVDVPLEGEDGLLTHLEKRMDARGHAVIVVAEGAGQHFCAVEGADKSGNKKLGDIGTFLRDRIVEHFKAMENPVTVKYIDPSYMIRGVPATPVDSVLCFRLAAYAAHAAMSGRTELIIGKWHGRFCHIPIKLAVSERQCVDPHGELWSAVLDATGQPRWAHA